MGEREVPLVGLMGTVTVAGRPVPATLDRLVLARLVLADGRSVAVGTLIDALWPAHPPVRAMNALQVKVSRLRALLGGQRHRLEHRHGGYRLAIDADESDVGVFTRLAQAAIRADDDRADLAAAALAAWHDELPADLDHDPVVHAERVRLRELWLTVREAHAEALSHRPATRADAVASLHRLLGEEPLRPYGRLILMRTLAADGRRAEALAVYDTGRRLFLSETGLEPPTELREEFDRILADERAAAHHPPAVRPPGRPPDALLETARWVADHGDVHIGLTLALRGCWWWWIGGKRTPARALLEDLLTAAGGVDDAATLPARAWLGVFGSTTDQAATRIADAEAALAAGSDWTAPQALAAALIAERLLERGEHYRATTLARAAARRFIDLDDAWGRSLVATVLTRARLLAGDIAGAEIRARHRAAEFTDLGDPAGLVLALDILGYCAEVRGRLDQAAVLHARALEIARQVGSPEWEAAQTIRLGNVHALAGRPESQHLLDTALRLSRDLGSYALCALVHNGLGVALDLQGDPAAALAHHHQAWTFYESTDSAAGLAYTGARIALVTGDSSATGQARDALDRAVTTNDPRAVAHSLEALALVTPDPHNATRALAAAQQLRASSQAPLPRRQAHRLQRRRAALADVLRNRYQPVWHQARRDPAAVVDSLRHADA